MYSKFFLEVNFYWEMEENIVGLKYCCWLIEWKVKYDILFDVSWYVLCGNFEINFKLLCNEFIDFIVNVLVDV